MNREIDSTVKKYVKYTPMAKEPEFFPCMKASGRHWEVSEITVYTLMREVFGTVAGLLSTWSQLLVHRISESNILRTFDIMSSLFL